MFQYSEPIELVPSAANLTYCDSRVTLSVEMHSLVTEPADTGQRRTSLSRERT